MTRERRGQSEIARRTQWSTNIVAGVLISVGFAGEIVRLGANAPGQNTTY